MSNVFDSAVILLTAAQTKLSGRAGAIVKSAQKNQRFCIILYCRHHHHCLQEPEWSARGTLASTRRPSGHIWVALSLPRPTWIFISKLQKERLEGRVLSRHFGLRRYSGPEQRWFFSFVQIGLKVDLLDITHCGQSETISWLYLSARKWWTSDLSAPEIPRCTCLQAHGGHQNHQEHELPRCTCLRGHGPCHTVIPGIESTQNTSVYLSARTWWYQGLALTKQPRSARRFA